MKKRILFITLIISLFLLASCSRGSPSYHSDPEYEQYYRGSEGVRMIILSGTPPPRLYYYSDAPSDEYNAFNIDVELHNVGASWAKGGVYVSGFDPTLIYVEGINIPRDNVPFYQNCRMALNPAGGWSEMLAVLNCNTADWGFEMGTEGLYVNNLFQIFGWQNGPEIDFSWDPDMQSTNFNFNFLNIGIDIDSFYHGQGLIYMLEAMGMTFDRFNGEAFKLAPDNYQFPGGESTIISFPSYIKTTWPNGLDYTNVPFQVTSCYAYSTFATPVVCIDPAPYSQDEKVCRPGEIQMTSSQGAPVSVTRVYQESSPRSVIFTIEIRNVGNGKIIYPGDLELCSPYYPGLLGPQSLDVVILGDVRVSGSNQRLYCTPDNRVIRLRDNKGSITCRYDLEYVTAKSAYRAPLVVELWYGYSQTETRNVYIKRVT